ncbi:MAG TPA: hypothetical protein VJU84_08800 [Pyrinomonadaceae bacterium]|nr:hypothetical protein [Pyrinomonadaceae bacterium]
MGTEIAIDKDRLRELARNPSNGVKEIVAGLGMSDPTFYQQLDRHPELKKIYQEARDEVRAARNGGSGDGTTDRPTSKRRYSKRATKAKRASRDTPPARDIPKQNHKDLFRKLRLEFDHIETYGEVSEHFSELREQLKNQ